MPEKDFPACADTEKKSNMLDGNAQDTMSNVTIKETELLAIL